jgi:hypothetical protein
MTKKEEIKNDNFNQMIRSKEGINIAAYPNPGDPKHGSCPYCTNGYFYSLSSWPGYWVRCDCNKQEEENLSYRNIMQNETNETIKKEAELIIAMSTDFLSGNISEEHYVRTMAHLFKTMHDRYKVNVLSDMILKWSRTK